MHWIAIRKIPLASPIWKHDESHRACLVNPLCGTGIVRRFHSLQLSLILGFCVVPRTREGYYHYQGGTDVSDMKPPTQPASKIPSISSRLLLRACLRMHLTRTCSGSRLRPPISHKPEHSLAGSEPSILESEPVAPLSFWIAFDFRFRWLVYNLSPSFNWAAHGFSGMLLLLVLEGSPHEFLLFRC